jgi:hypothetical protein
LREALSSSYPPPELFAILLSSVLLSYQQCLLSAAATVARIAFVSCLDHICEAGGSGKCANGRALEFDAAARCVNGRTLGFQNGLASRNRVLRRSVVAAVVEEGAREEIEDDDGEGYDSLEEDIGFQGE